MKQTLPKLLLAGALLVAVALRLWGIDYDLPYIYHADEPVPVDISLRMLKTGDLNPHFFHWPSLLVYINLLAYIPYYLLGKLLGTFNTPQDIPALIELTLGAVYAPAPGLVLLGRIITASFGLGAVLLCFLIGRQLTGKAWAGGLAAFMMAVSPAGVAHSRYITSDMLVVFFNLASFFGSVLIFQQGKTRHYILAGVCAGLAASSKYNGALIAIPLMAAHFLRHGRHGFKERNLYLALILSGLAFLITTPFAVLDAPKFITDLAFDSRHYASGHAGMEGDTLRWYLNYLWRTTGLIGILAVLEILRGVYARSKPTLLLSVFPVTYFLFISRYVVRNDRTALPLMPFLFLLSAALVVHLWGRANASPSRLWARALSIALAGLTIAALILPASLTLRETRQLTVVNSRETARIWIQDNLPPGAQVAIERYTPFVDPTRFSAYGVSRMIDNPPEWYVANGFDYLVFGQAMFGRFYAEPDKYSQEISQYESFFQRFRLLRQFTDGGYEVRVYQVEE
jgi:4-amino-4-deoxy-L-arabinose transferase-like glycosyltransferase